MINVPDYETQTPAKKLTPEGLLRVFFEGLAITRVKFNCARVSLQELRTGWDCNRIFSSKWSGKVDFV